MRQDVLLKSEPVRLCCGARSLRPMRSAGVGVSAAATPVVAEEEDDDDEEEDDDEEAEEEEDEEDEEEVEDEDDEVVDTGARETADEAAAVTVTVVDSGCAPALEAPAPLIREKKKKKATGVVLFDTEGLGMIARPRSIRMEPLGASCRGRRGMTTSLLHRSRSNRSKLTRRRRNPCG